MRSALERPKTGRLASVLGTLQPDQYRLVTWPDGMPLVVQGGPGTGKTVVAAHRASYLTHMDREPRPLHRIALVGPTDQYVRHVSDTIRELDTGGYSADTALGTGPHVAALSLPDRLTELAGLPRGLHLDERESDRLDTDWRLGRLVEKTVSVLKSGNRLPTKKNRVIKFVVDAMGARDPDIRNILAAEPELDEWFAGVGSYERARTKRRYIPFLASVGIALQAPSSSDRFDHLICDEAQDVRPLEWRILMQYLNHGAQLSIFGDINQRRSDWSPESWQELAIDLELSDEDGRFEPETLNLGLRTTRQIVRFANQLLPAGQRAVHTLRDGPEPAVHKLAYRDLAREAMSEASVMSSRHPAGLVAVISVSPPLISDGLRSSGWSRSADRHTWTLNGRTVLVLDPDSARRSRIRWGRRGRTRFVPSESWPTWSALHQPHPRRP